MTREMVCYLNLGVSMDIDILPALKRPGLSRNLVKFERGIDSWTICRDRSTQPLQSWRMTQDHLRRISAAYNYRSRGIEHLAKAAKSGNADAIEFAAQTMAPLVPHGAELVPIPSRTGRATITLALATRIAEIQGGLHIRDVLCGVSRPSWREHKKAFGDANVPEWLKFEELTDGMAKTLQNPVCIDVVCATGATFGAARSVVPAASLLVFAQDLLKRAAH